MTQSWTRDFVPPVLASELSDRLAKGSRVVGCMHADEQAGHERDRGFPDRKYGDVGDKIAHAGSRSSSRSFGRTDSSTEIPLHLVDVIGSAKSGLAPGMVTHEFGQLLSPAAGHGHLTEGPSITHDALATLPFSR